MFRPGVQHGKADAFSQRPDFALHPGDDTYSQQSHCLLWLDQLHMFATYRLHDDYLLNEIVQATTLDPFATDIMARLNNPSQEMQSSDLSHFATQDGLLYHNHPLYVPAGTCRTGVLQTSHDDPFVSHFGVVKTSALFSQGFWWPQPWSKNLSKPVTSVLTPKMLTIVHTTFYTHFQFPIDLGLLSPWTLSPTFVGLVTMTQC